MEYPQPPAAPIAIQFMRELTSPQTLRFIVVIGLLALVSFELIVSRQISALRDPFMLIVGTMFEPVSSALAQQRNAPK